MKLIKYIGVGILILLSIGVGFIIFAIIIFAPSNEMSDAKWVVQNPAFQQLHQDVRHLDRIRNIAVLPEKQYVVLDGIVINQEKKTFGQEPALGFYANYYKEGDQTKYSSLERLFQEQHIAMDTVTALAIIDQMKQLKLADILVRDSTITYSWEVSAMYGEEGILYCRYPIPPIKSEYDVLEKVGDGFYHFAVDDK